MKRVCEGCEKDLCEGLQWFAKGFNLRVSKGFVKHLRFGSLN